MATPVFLPDTQFDAFGGLGLSKFSNGVDLKQADFNGSSLVFARLSNVDSSGNFVERPASGVIKAQKWNLGWLVLKANGSAVAFSDVGSGVPVLRTDLPSAFQSDVQDISASGRYAVAIKADGSLAHWFTVASAPALPSGSNFVEISVADNGLGSVAGVAARSDGSAVSWVGNSLVAIPAGLNNVISVSVASRRSGSIEYINFIALKRDGTLVSWSGGGYGDVWDVSSINSIVHISSKSSTYDNEFFAIDSRGRVYGRWIAGQQLNVVSGENGYFLKNNGYVVDINDNIIQQNLLSEINQVYKEAYVRRDGSIVLFTTSQRMLPMDLRLSVNSLGSNDFSVAYDGAIKNITPNYEMPLGRSAVSAVVSPENPRNVGTYAISYSISDFSYKIASADTAGTLTITPGAPIITVGQTLSGVVGAFSRTPALTDSTNRPATSWAATDLPGWATLNATTGAITGTPQDTGSATITLTATGPGGEDTETATISIAAGPPIITAGQSFAGKVGEVFSQTPELDDALDRPAISWSATGLPAGLALDTTTGAISGTPTARGSFTASFTAAGGSGASAATSIAFTITEGAPIITAGQVLSGVMGAAFNRTPALTDSANRPATSWAATGLPSWATLDAATGAIVGTPQGGGSATITLTATGPGGTSAAITATISVISALVITWPGQDVREGEEVRFFANTGSLPGGVQSGVYYFVSSKLSGGGFTISSTRGGAPIGPTSQSWTGTYRAQLKSRSVRGATTDIQYIGIKPGDGAEWESGANSIVLWGYNYNASGTPPAGAVSRLLKAEDLEYSDMSAMNWIISGSGVPAASSLGDGTLKTELAIEHALGSGGGYLASWPVGGDSLVDIDARNQVNVKGVVLGDLTIISGFSGGLQVSMLSYLNGNKVIDNMCSLYIKFFDTHSNSSVDEYRQGGGVGWLSVLEFGENPNSARIPVLGPYAIYKIVRGSPEQGLGPDALVSVSLRIKLRD